METLDLLLGTGDDSLLVTGTHSGATTINSGGGSDIVNVQATGGVTTVTGGAGDDQVRVSSDAPAMLTGDLNGITHALTVQGDEGMDTLRVSDVGDATDDDGTLSPDQIHGLGNAGAIS